MLVTGWFFEGPKDTMTAPVRQDDDSAEGGTDDDLALRVRSGLAERPLVLIGLMGAGKSTIGRRLADRLGLPFADADTEIERAAGMAISEIFAAHGEPYFRDGERRVIARLLREGGRVIATGGGAYMNADTRAAIAEAGLSVWLKADLDVLMRRVRKRNNRPLLQADDPDAVMRRLMDERYPVYSQANIMVQSRDAPFETVVGEVIEAIAAFLDGEAARREGTA